jgi:oxygen-independent coproporphyrinogen-3 oxidase
MAAIARNGHGLQREDALSPRDRATEALVMGLRLAEGIDLARLANGGIDVAAILDPVAVQRLADTGLVERTPTRLRLTDAGMPLLDAVLREVSRAA